MIFAPKPLGNRQLKRETLAEDKKHCEKIGPCGIGREAIYLNSFFVDRTYYVTWTDVRRCFKRIAMSSGGYSGKGIFGAVPYLVVRLSNGQEKQCNFKYETDVDRFLARVHKLHPEIPIHSEAAEQRLRRAEMEEEARYLKELSPAAEESVKALRNAQSYLTDKPQIGISLSEAAKRKRSVDGVRKSNLIFAWVIVALGAAALAFGIYRLAAGESAYSMYLLLFGAAALFFTAGTGILPSVKRNRRTVQRDWDAAVSAAQDYIDGYPSFPVPAQYAHEIVLERMIRIIREGKTEDVGEAFDLMKEELKSLDNTKTVSQKEYDEIVTIKPMFRVMGYQ